MNGPRVVCFGCGEPTSLSKPICDRCRGLTGVPDSKPEPYCALCERGLPVDKWGLHTSTGGGYAGKCTAGRTQSDNSGTEHG